MSYVDEILAMKSPPRKKKPAPEPPKAEVIPLPQGAALAVAKEDRTRASEISEALDAAEQNRRARWLHQQDREEAERGPRYPQGYEAAGERFNEVYQREAERARREGVFDPTRPHGFW